MKLTLNINKSLEENAQTYFEKAKQARKKLVGAKKVVEKFKKKHEEEKLKSAQNIETLEKEKQEKQKKKRKLEWFEKFRWFISSDGFLVVGGRDATTNEILIKKQTDAKDIVCHTDMAGSPFFVIKQTSQKKEITEATIQEAIDATFLFSRAWKLGLLSSKTFYVNPEQVSKKANAGEFLPKGAFMIRGKTNYLAPRAKIAIGRYKDTVMAGPYDAVKENCKECIEIIQGRRKPSDIAKALKKTLDSDIDRIIAVLPPGNCDIKSKY